MKKFVAALGFAALLLTACASSTPESADSGDEVILVVSYGETELLFSAADLQALPASESTFNDVAYQGVSILALIDQLGISIDDIQAVKAVAADGYSINYDPGQVLKEEVLVAYGLADGSPLTEDDGTFRMVLPGEEGKLNLRMLVELQFFGDD